MKARAIIITVFIMVSFFFSSVYSAGAEELGFNGKLVYNLIVEVNNARISNDTEILYYFSSDIADDHARYIFHLVKGMQEIADKCFGNGNGIVDGLEKEKFEMLLSGHHVVRYVKYTVEDMMSSGRDFCNSQEYMKNIKRNSGLPLLMHKYQIEARTHTGMCFESCRIWGDLGESIDYPAIADKLD